MSASAIRLLISDVDGTLVGSDKALAPATVAAAARLRDAGVSMALISARPPSGIAPLARELGLDTPFGAFNGGTIVGADGEIVERCGIDRDIVMDALALAAEHGVTPWLFANGCWYAPDEANPHVPREKRSAMQDPVIRRDLSPHADAADKLTLVSDDHALLAQLERHLCERFCERATVALSQPYYLDITAPAANKGTGIERLAAAIGVELDAVAVIGDMPNDLPMFARAGLAIAMGQAPDEVREAADLVTDDNDSDGVAKAIADIILPRVEARAA
ncbi:MAG: HAD family hydrolase [Sphingomonas sp.]